MCTFMTCNSEVGGACSPVVRHTLRLIQPTLHVFPQYYIKGSSLHAGTVACLLPVCHDVLMPACLVIIKAMVCMACFDI